LPNDIDEANPLNCFDKVNKDKDDYGSYIGL